MAVYTQLTQADIEAFLKHYSVGHLVSFSGITEGTDNTNYLIKMGQGSLHHSFILTIFEQRINKADLPFFLGLTSWLADNGIACPQPVKGKDKNAVYTLKGKPASLIHFIEGKSPVVITPLHMQQTGELAARLHLTAEGFKLIRRNTLSIEGWHNLFIRLRGHADTISPGLEKTIRDELAFLDKHWPHGLPAGVIHADLFPDNVFFMNDGHHHIRLSGVIDFYFACNDFWMYDLAICMNAWCFNFNHEFVPERAQALFSAYERRRPLSRAEHLALPVLARGAALRFLLTRAYDWLNTASHAQVRRKDPMEYVTKLHFHQQVQGWRDYGL